jgi:hypothetical protein
MMAPPNSEQKTFEENQQSSPWLTTLKQKMSDLLTKLDTRQIQTTDLLHSETGTGRRKSTKQRRASTVERSYSLREQTPPENDNESNDIGMTFSTFKSKIVSPLLIQLIASKQNLTNLIERHPEVAVVSLVALLSVRRAPGFVATALSVGCSPLWTTTATTTSLTTQERKKETLIYCKLWYRLLL